MTFANAWRVSGIVGALLVLWTLIACAPATRDKVLSFFFDGVPSPEEKTPSEIISAREPSPFREALSMIPRPTATAAAPPIISVHKPVAERKCRECHDVRRGAEAIALDARLCDRCHEEQRQHEGWNHGPINLNTCVPCHRPHESQYPHLLEKPLPELCLFCHSEDFKRQTTYHELPDVDNCTTCHNAHLID